MSYNNINAVSFLNDDIKHCRSLLEERFKGGYSAFVHSFGCQQNEADTESIKGILSELGFSFCQNEEDAELILFNTCAVRESAEDRVLGHIGAIKYLKMQNKDKLIIVCGCMTQRSQMREKLKNSYPFVDIVFGTGNISLMPKFIIKRIKLNKKIYHSPMGTDICGDLPIIRENKIKAWLPIMQGCDNFCSYCIVPYVRGREVSKSFNTVISEVKNLVDEGYKEITLLGQNVNSYGKGNDDNVTFADLVREIDKIDGDYIVRFMTSHPKDCSFMLLDEIAKSHHFCHHLHLPVQSGSNKILKEMNRNYTIERYMDLINYAREKIPDITLSTDIIVGFPNESNEDFMKTYELVKNLKFSTIFSFIYSKRSGTNAALIEDKISYSEKTERMNKLLKLQQKLSDNLNNELVGKIQRVLFDSMGKNKGEILGRTTGNIIVSAIGDSYVIGKFADVKITSAMSAAIKGEIDKIY